MKAKRPKNARTRMMLTLQLAVMLPAAVLVILSAWHLKTIQRDRAVEAAIQRDFSQVLAISEKQINHKAYELVDDVRADFPPPGEACTETMDRILSTHPYVAHLMLYDPEQGFVMRSQPYRMKNDPGFRDQAEHMSKMMEGWWKLEYAEFSKKLAKMADKGIPYYFDGEWVPGGDKPVYLSTAVFLRTDKETGKSAIASVTFDGDYLRNQFLPQTLDEVMSRNVAEAQTDKNAVIMTFDRSLILHRKSRTVEILWLGRAHTDGDVFVFLPKEKVLVTGDALHGWTPYMADSYPYDWIKTLDVAEKLDFDYAIGGHGAVMRGKQMFELWKQYFSDLLDQTAAVYADGATLDQAKKRVSDYLVSKYAAKFDPKFPQSVGSNVIKAYQVTAFAP